MRRPLQPAQCHLAAPPLRCPASACHACCADHEGRPIQFDTWLDDLQLYLLSASRDSVSLFDHTSGAAPAPPDTTDSATRSQWLTCDAAARLAIPNHPSLAECAHFGKHRTAQALYDAVVARHSSPPTTALGHLLLPYLFPKLSAFATVEDLVSHLRTSNARYRAALPAEFLAKNPPLMDHFLALDPTALTVDLLEQHLLAAETSVVAVGAARGTPRTPFFEGCSPSPLAPSYASAAAAEVPGAEDVGAASASAKRRSNKGKGGRGGGGGSGGGNGGSSGGGGGIGGGGSGMSGGGSGMRVGALVAAVEAAVGVAVMAAVGVVALGMELSVEVLEEARGSSSTVARRPRRPSSFTCGKFHTQHRCLSSLDDAWRAEFGEEAERPCWAELLSAEGDCYRCVPLDPGIEAAALGASESSLSGTAPGEAFHTFTLDSGASSCLFHDSTTLTPLPAPVPVRLADPSGVPIVARSSNVLPCPAVPSGLLSGLHLPSYTTVFPMLSKVQVVDVLIHCIRAVRLQLRARFREDLPVLRVHSDRGGEFSSDLLWGYCRGEGIFQSCTLPDSPQQNGIAERRIGLVMEVARTSMIHAAAPHFLWPFAVWYAAHQLNLWPHVSSPKTSSTLRWTGEVGDALVFRV
ncbi:unnamed protein product [Closterium sp. NIES-53]